MSYSRIQDHPLVVLSEKSVQASLDEVKSLAVILGVEDQLQRLESTFEAFWPAKKAALTKSKLSLLSFLLSNPTGVFFEEAFARWKQIFAWAVERGYVGVVKAVGVLPDTEMEGGLPALHRSAFECNVEMVRFLIESGADVNAQDRAGNTPVDYAIFARLFVSSGDSLQQEVLSLLKEAGGDSGPGGEIKPHSDA